MTEHSKAAAAREALLEALAHSVMVSHNSKRIATAIDAYALAVHVESCGIVRSDGSVARARYFGCGDNYLCERAEALAPDTREQHAP